MPRTAEEMLATLQTIKTYTDDAISAVQRLLEETKRFSQEQAATEGAPKETHPNLESQLFSSLSNVAALKPIADASPIDEASHSQIMHEATPDERENLFSGLELNGDLFSQSTETTLGLNRLVSAVPSSPRNSRVAGIKNKNGTKMFKRAAQAIEVPSNEAMGTFSSPSELPRPAVIGKKNEVDLAFDWSDWHPTDFPLKISFLDILGFMLQGRDGGTPMAIASKANLSQPCFNVATVVRYATNQFDRLIHAYVCSEPEVSMARQLLCEVISSWGGSDGVEAFNVQELTANRRPPMLRYYFFARLCIKNYGFPVPSEDRKRAALSSFVAGLAVLCIPSAINATNNLTSETVRAVFDEAVGLVEDRCNSKLYHSARHLVLDNLVMVSVYGCKFSPQRFLSHTWTMPPAFTTPEILTDPSRAAPYYIAMRLSHELVTRLTNAGGIIPHAADQILLAFKSKNS